MNERQAQLEENIVAENLASVYKRIEPYSKLILGAVVAIVIVLIGIGFYRSEQSAKRSDATFDLLMENPEVASRYPGTVAASWSLLFQANDNLAQGINALYQDRDEAETLLSQAKDQFQDAAASSKDPLLVSRATFGLGMAAESMGQIDEAVEAYKRTVAANESEQMVEVAQDRIDRLSKPGTSDFLAWFSEQDFSPADPSLPPELPGASSLPDLPDLDLPQLDLGNSMNESSDGETSAPPAEGGLELPQISEPATDDSAVVTEKSDAEEPSDSESAESGDATKPVSESEPAASDEPAAESGDGDAPSE